ncbi:dTDP-4-dehydrorhamnose 3,5-epimerase [Desulfobaculum xiamenense]|uniref:dTDP-4-dehydrorhamnose 3,5-epimerase n=1 Tax=Desulfobaculum xiamenense TaxID=995050 RepID=A0A846QLK0_9BACT|nr:dTDP-4-dehydrorhamnose 3,5-epimerase [Desulfobaculum xiamenense]
MEFQETDFPGLFVIRPKVHGDRRGFFLESWSRREFAAHGVDVDFVQDNHARSLKAGVLRGLHFQTPPAAQAKLVRVTRGAVYDVVVDLRVGSPTYGRWHAETLSDENFLQMFVPAGFAHAYVTLCDEVEFQYKVDAFYAPGSDSGIIWNDPDLAITWPVENPVLSDKDLKLQRFRDFVSPFSFDPR